MEKLYESQFGTGNPIDEFVATVPFDTILDSLEAERGFVVAFLPAAERTDAEFRHELEHFRNEIEAVARKYRQGAIYEYFPIGIIAENSVKNLSTRCGVKMVRRTVPILVANCEADVQLTGSWWK